MLASVFQRTSSPVKHVGYGTGVRGTFRPTWCITAAGGRGNQIMSQKRLMPIPTKLPVSALSHNATRASATNVLWRCTWAHIVSTGYSVIIIAVLFFFSQSMYKKMFCLCFLIVNLTYSSPIPILYSFSSHKNSKSAAEPSQPEHWWERWLII